MPRCETVGNPMSNTRVSNGINASLLEAESNTSFPRALIPVGAKDSDPLDVSNLLNASPPQMSEASPLAETVPDCERGT